jgi:broad specificity phosphatase PhoE
VTGPSRLTISPHPRLILVRHSVPEVDRGRPASHWPLSTSGRERCAALARELARYRPAALVASEEPKARETARLVGARWGQAHQTRVGLHEHRRETVGWLGQEAFAAAVQSLFARPAEAAFGEESAEAASARFEAAVAAALESQRQNLIIVAHGTVIALFAQRKAGIDGYRLWQQLGLPSFIVLALPGWTLERVVAQVL